MAAIPAPTLAVMLAADSDFVMPTNDKDVQAALAPFGAIYRRTPGEPHISERAELLAGLALPYTSHCNLQPLVGALTIALQQVSATAHGLDFQAFGTDMDRHGPQGGRHPGHKSASPPTAAVVRRPPGGPDRRRRFAPGGDLALHRPGVVPTRAVVRAGLCPPILTTSPTRPSSPSPCAGRSSRTPGIAA